MNRQEAIKVVRDNWPDGRVLLKSALEILIPELKESESEDERIRKAIKLLIKLKENDSIGLEPVYGASYKEMISWLEKQGKQEQLYIRFGEIPTDEKSKIYQGEIEVGTENGVSVYPAFKTDKGDIVLGLNLPITKTTLYTQQHLIEYDDRPCYLVKGDYIGKDTDGQPLLNNVRIVERIDSYRVKEEKQGEQKPTEIPLTLDEAITHCKEKSYGNSACALEHKQLAQWLTELREYNNEQKPTDNVEPKFEIEKDKWYVCIKPRYTNFIVGKVYPSPKDGMLSSETMSQYVVKHCFRLWSIQDAKDGDVIVFDDAFILIFKEIIDLKLKPPLFKKVRGFYFKSYINLDFLMNVFEQGNFCYGIGHSCQPATKEQRELLFQKIVEAGYVWDPEKKELKQIEHNIA